MQICISRVVEISLNNKNDKPFPEITQTTISAAKNIHNRNGKFMKKANYKDSWQKCCESDN